MALENLHLTLRFFGDVSDEIADELAARLDEIHAEPFEFKIAGSGTFGGRGETVIYAAVADTLELANLQKSHERIARSLGLGSPEHPFKPHITLARVRYARPSAWARFLAETATLSLPPIPVTEFVLLSSRSGRGGGPYALELAVPLGAE
jgi:RNA 2',3'-cyclic 3'-phosphodiesterase